MINPIVFSPLIIFFLYIVLFSKVSKTPKNERTPPGQKYVSLTEQFKGAVIQSNLLSKVLVVPYNDSQITLTSALVKRGGKSTSVTICTYCPKTSLPIVNDHSGWNDPWLFNSIQEWSFGIRDKRFSFNAKMLDWRNHYQPEYTARLSPNFDTYGNSQLLNRFLTADVCKAIIDLSNKSALDIMFHPGGKWNGKSYEPHPVPCFDIRTPSSDNDADDAAVVQLSMTLIPVLEQTIGDKSPLR